jgi:integrase
MPRPPLDVGTYGSINVRELRPKRHEARARFRMADGRLKLVRRVGTSPASATASLKRAMSALVGELGGAEVSGDTRVKSIADLWHAEIEREASIGDRSHNTVRIYTSLLDNWILPRLGALRARELTVMACDKLIKAVHDKTSYDTAKSVRTVLAGVCGYAVRHGAMTTNPVKSVGRLARGQQRDVQALDAEQRAELLARLEEFAEDRRVDARGRSLGGRASVWLDLPDVVRSMLATGVRLGELLGLSGSDVDPAKQTVAIDHHLIRVTGTGLVRVPGRKGNAKGLLLRVPDWSVSMLRRRKLAAGEGPLFASANGEWLDPSNVIHRVREAFTEIGYGWVTSHVFRKTVASVLDDADLPLSALADQLGNTQTVADKHYRRRRVANEASAHALEAMLSDEAGA